MERIRQQCTELSKKKSHTLQQLSQETRDKEKAAGSGRARKSKEKWKGSKGKGTGKKWRKGKRKGGEGKNREQVSHVDKGTKGGKGQREVKKSTNGPRDEKWTKTRKQQKNENFLHFHIQTYISIKHK